MLINRSRFVVSVKNRPELTEEFPFNQPEAARRHLEKLRGEGHSAARITQNEDRILVRIRDKGHKPLNKTFPSYKAAQNFETLIMAERAQGVFVDYGKSIHTTVADLIRRYIRDELPRMKGGSNYEYFFQAMLDDSEGVLERDRAERDRELAEKGTSSIKIKAAREFPMESIEWVQKPFAELIAADIEDWMRSREGDVALSTIWREYELLRAMINLAINTWGYPMRINPTKGVRAIDFQNERDRRLVDDEFDRIMKAAQEWDAAKSLEARVQELIWERLAHESFSSPSKRKHRMVAVRKKVTPLAEETYVHRPTMEAFILFQCATGARRGESLKLPWAAIDFAKKTAFLAETKNGRARSLALRDDLIELLKELPRRGDLVFGLTVKTCRTAWQAIVEAAGIEDLNIHDLRHEAISAAAECGMTLAELQAFSGHRDVRMLLRYTHLCMSKIADKLSSALAAGTIKNGRRRMKAGELTVSALLNESPVDAPVTPIATVAPRLQQRQEQQQQGSGQVIPFPVRRQAGNR